MPGVLNSPPNWCISSDISQTVVLIDLIMQYGKALKSLILFHQNSKRHYAPTPSELFKVQSWLYSLEPWVKTLLKGCGKVKTMQGSCSGSWLRQKLFQSLIAETWEYFFLFLPSIIFKVLDKIIGPEIRKRGAEGTYCWGVWFCCSPGSCRP